MSWMDGPGVMDRDVMTVLICECGFDDSVEATARHGVAYGDCPDCGIPFEHEEW